MLWYVLYKSSIDIEPLSLTIDSVNARFIHHPSNVENYLIGHKLETGQPKKPFCQFWGKNSEYPSLQKFGKFFDISPIGT